MRTVRELWNDLFDDSLESLEKEDEAFRSLSMILHIFKLEFRKINHIVLELKKKTEELKENSHPKLQCDKQTYRTPLRNLGINYNETTPVKSKPTNHPDISIIIDSDGDDIFNHQITDLDINSSKENDNSLLFDNSVEDFDTSTSPTLSNKRKRKNLKKKNVIKDIIMNTPTPKLDKSKKFKQSKLNLTFRTNTSRASESTILRANDTDETLFLPAEPQNIVRKVDSVPSDTEVVDILVNLKETAGSANKRIEMANSFDCVTEKDSDSPDFVYKREAVKKKSERMKLQGWECADCEKYYSTFKHKMTDEELKKKKNQCSRHRDKFNPNILTPKGFWNPDFPPTQESLVLYE